MFKLRLQQISQGNTEKQKSWKVELMILEYSFCFFHALDIQI